MSKPHEAGVESAAAVLRHPIHPMLVPLPITAFIGALCADVVNLFVNNAFWSQLSYWLLFAGILTGILAGVVGALDYTGVPGVRSLAAAQLHAIGNLTVLTIALCNLGVRWYRPTHFSGWPIILSAATVGLLAITGWLGGSLVYKHRVGQIAPEHGGRNPARRPAE